MKTKPKTKPAPVIPDAATQIMEGQQIAAALRISVHFFWRMLAAGEYPPADFYIGRLPRWTVATHNAWVASKKAGA